VADQRTQPGNRDLTSEPSEQRPARIRRSPDVLNLAMAVVTLTASAMVLADWRPPLDPRWLLAAGAVLVGLLLLLASLRPSRGDRANR
jgi:hypothetical protein